jgi:hypothetical protein
MKNHNKLKNLLILTTLVFLLSSGAFAQDSFYGKVYYGISDAALLPDGDWYGLAGKDVEGFREFGFRFGKEFNKKWAIEVGLNSASADVKIIPHHPNMIPGDELSQSLLTENYQLLSFPVLMRYSIFPFLYINAGPMLDIQLSNNSFDIQSSGNSFKSQSGIGYLLGISAEHYFNKVGVFVHPHFKRHATIPFGSTIYNLTEFGVQFGVGYKF